MNGTSVETAKAVEQQQLLERLGIRHVLTDVFCYRDYRYGKLHDAVAQATRDRAPAAEEKQP